MKIACAIKKRLSGNTLIFSIMIFIVLTSSALIFLSYLNGHRYSCQVAINSAIARRYCYDGMQKMITSKAEDTNTLYLGNYRLSLKKKVWGFYDLYYSTVYDESKVLESKIGLVGNGRDASDSTAIVITAKDNQVYVADNVKIKGVCYFLNGDVRMYSSAKPQPILTIRDNNSLKIDYKVEYLRSRLADLYETEPGKHARLIDDSTCVSFKSNSLIITGDTIILNKAIQGNVIVTANYIKVMSQAKAKDVILFGKKIVFDKHYEGSLQAIATESIIVDSFSDFRYPTILALLPSVKQEKDFVNEPFFIDLGYRAHIAGEIYAAADSARVNQNMVIRISNSSTVIGNIRTTAYLQMSGICFGQIICGKWMNDKGTQENMLANIRIDIDSFPVFFTSGNGLEISASKKKIVKWIN